MKQIFALWKQSRKAHGKPDKAKQTNKQNKQKKVSEYKLIYNHR